jgi:small subunit ribosomal protein S17
MADDETPETTEEQNTATADAAGPDSVPTHPATAPAEAEAEAAPAPEAAAEPAAPVAALTPKERKVASRARRGTRRAATPEERAEARKAKATARSRYRTKKREKVRAARTEAGPAKTQSPVKDGEAASGLPKERLGIVVSDKADKTITVRIDTARRHRRYQKIVRSSMTLHAHDETNDANAGDRVRVIESRPLSATKRWRLVEILERAK